MKHICYVFISLVTVLSLTIPAKAQSGNVLEFDSWDHSIQSSFALADLATDGDCTNVDEYTIHCYGTFTGEDTHDTYDGGIYLNFYFASPDGAVVFYTPVYVDLCGQSCDPDNSQFTMIDTTDCMTGVWQIGQAMTPQICHDNMEDSSSVYRVQIYMHLPGDNPNGTPVSGEWEFYLSMAPPCESSYILLTSDTYEIDPVIETPLGPEGVPADDQVYPTVTGQVYKITTDGGPWNDGTTDRGTETAVSWDGATWTPFDDLIPLCESVDGIYIEAESDAFYIRVDDTAGNFADNTNNPDPVTYTIALAVSTETFSCETQFTYDEELDWVASIVVQGNDADGVLATSELVTGEWYAIVVASGSWQDEGSPPDHFDMDYYNGPEEFAFFEVPYADLDSTGSNVGCVQDMTVYMQAANALLYLRANDPLEEFENNTGALDVNIFHATFTRTTDACETNFRIGDLIDTGSVEGGQENGDTFAFMVGTDVAHLDYGLTPGAWYVLDTTAGPWQWKGATHSANGIAYDMAVDDGTDWMPLEDWTTPECNIALDALGHRRIVFQMPEAGAVDWKLRVNDSSLWLNNGGMMGWNLYGATLMQSSLPGGGCDYSYDEFTTIDVGEVAGNNASGVLLDGLNPGELYAIKIVGTSYGWQEQFLGDDLFDMQISHNAGTQFYSLPDDYPAALCSEVDGDDLIVYVQPGANYNYILRVDSTTFSNNTGEMGYIVFPATAGQTVENTCLDGYSLQIINEFEWLDVRSETGELISADTARYEEFNGLVEGRTYMIETPAGQGPWNDGSASSWDIAVTNDNGATWQSVDFDNTDVDCVDRDLIGHIWKARITVAEGDVWKIRVDDTAGAFADNSGNMAYKVYVLCEGMACTGSVPNDSTVNGIPGITVQGGGDVCTIPIIRPSPLTVSEIFDLGNYLGSWTQYLNLSVLRYMAWCPRHTNTFLQFLNKFNEREPFATIREWNDRLREIQSKIDAYDWGVYENTSIFSMTSATQVQQVLAEHVLRTDNESFNPWDGEDVVDFDDTGSGIPSSYSACLSSFDETMPSRLASGVCFASSWAKETGMSFWVQLSFDIGAIFMLVMILKRNLQDVIYMMTGVKPWQKGIEDSSIGNLGKYLDGVERSMSDGQRSSDAVADALAKQGVAGKWSRNFDGTWSRRD